MKRIFHKSKSYREAEAWDIQQCIRMTPDERQAAALELRKRVYGRNAPDVRECNHHFIGHEQLIKNKEAIRRNRDLDDLKYLRGKWNS